MALTGTVAATVGHDGPGAVGEVTIAQLNSIEFRHEVTVHLGEDVVQDFIREGLAGLFVFGFPEIGLDPR